MTAPQAAAPRTRLCTLWLAVLMACMLLAGLALRLDGLGSKSLWEDELFSADIVRNRALLPDAGAPWLRRIGLDRLQPQDSFWTVKGADQSPPMFELAGKAVTAVLGDSEWALRMTSALPAALALLWLALRAWRGREGPQGVVFLTVLTLLAFSGLMVFYAQEARAYSLGAALATVLVGLLWQRLALGWRQSALPGWGEVALAAAACMSHYNALALTGICMACYSAEALRRRDWRALARMAALAPLVLAWLWLAGRGLKDGASGIMGWVAPMGFGQALGLVGQRLAQEALGWPLLALLLAALALGGLALVWPAGQGGANAKPLPPAQPSPRALARASLALAAVGLVYLLAAAYVVHKSRIESVRHLIFLLPLVFFIAGNALALLAGRWGRGWALPLLLGMALAQWPAVMAARQAPKSDYRAAAAFLLKGLQDGDTVLAGFMLNAQGSYSYYLGPRSGRHVRLRVLAGPELAAQFCPDTAGPRVGLIYPVVTQGVVDALVQHCASGRPVEKFEVQGVRAQLWTR